MFLNILLKIHMSCVCFFPFVCGRLPMLGYSFIKTLFICNTFVQNNEIDGMNPRGTKFNQHKESYIGAHTPPFNRCHMFPGFPQIFLEEMLHCVYDFAKHCGIELRSPSACMFYIERGWSTITKPNDTIDGHTHITHTISSAYAVIRLYFC